MGIRLDGTGDWLIHSTARAAWNGDQVTLAFWVRRYTGAGVASPQNAASIGGYNPGGPGGMVFEWSGPSFIKARVQTGPTVFSTISETGTTADQWHLVVIRSNRTGPVSEFFFDGSQVGADNTTGTRGSGASPFALGTIANDPGTDVAPGDFAEAAIWSSILTDTHIQNLLNGGSGGNGASPSDIDSGNLISHWPLTDNSDLTDVISGFDLTTAGDPASTGHPPVDAPSGGGVTGVAGERGTARGVGRGVGRGVMARTMEKLNGIWRPDRRLVVPVGISLQGA